MGSLALLTIVLFVAAVDDLAVTICGMPDLRAVPTAAVGALYLVGEDADPTVPRFAFLDAFFKPTCTKS